MLKALVKKQLLEFFRTFVYNEKKKKARSKTEMIAYLVLYLLLVVVVLGAVFAFLAISMCKPLFDAGVGWLYYTMLGMMGIALGTFGSVFNTYATLFTAKDNDLLLSMPIPEKYIVISRLLSVYIIGTVFSAVVTVPAVIVSFVTVKQTVLSVIGSIVFIIVISGIILFLSCLLGYAVAKIAAKIKSKSFVTVLASLVFFGLYYFCYFKANELIQTVIENASVIGAKIKGAVYPLYFFGKIGEGSVVSILTVTALTVTAVWLTCRVISSSFRKLATATPVTGKAKHTAKVLKAASASTALYRKEMKRFSSSPSYILNCAFGTLFLIAGAVAFVIKGDYFIELFTSVLSQFGYDKSVLPVVFALILCLLASMNDTAAASVSLEGKSIWILQTLPVSANKILRAKIEVQLTITCLPLLITSICAAVVLKCTLLNSVLIIILPQCFAFLSSCFDLAVNLKGPNLNWTNEIVPIKQSLCMMTALLSSLINTLIFAVAAFFTLRSISVEIFMSAAAVITAALGVVIYMWINKKGSRIFVEL